MTYETKLCYYLKQEGKGKQEFYLEERENTHLIVVDVVNMDIIGKHAKKLYVDHHSFSTI